MVVLWGWVCLLAARLELLSEGVKLLDVCRRHPDLRRALAPLV